MSPERCPSCGEALVRAEGDFCPGCGTYVPPGTGPAPGGGAPPAEPPPAGDGPPAGAGPAPGGDPPPAVRQPGGAGPVPGPPSPGVHEAPPPPPAPERPCPSCATPNPPDRTLCRRCGARLDAGPPAAATAPAGTAGPRRRRPRWLGLGLAAVAVAALVAFLALRGSDGAGTRATPAGGPAATPGGPEPVVLDPRLVTATATSTQDDERVGDQVFTYGAANTLDGDPSTAWNSDGDRVGPGPGQAITFTFAEPVDLAFLRVANGYQLSDAVFRFNARVAEADITTDAGTARVALADERGLQRVDGDFGLTTSLRLEVVSVHPGEAVGGTGPFDDVALSEVEFLARPRT